jgi:hypothetical protein
MLLPQEQKLLSIAPLAATTFTLLFSLSFMLFIIFLFSWGLPEFARFQLGLYLPFGDPPLHITLNQPEWGRESEQHAIGKMVTLVTHLDANNFLTSLQAQL